MELELERIQRNGHEAVLDTVLNQEETLETIVPDACPDILRICNTEASVELGSREAREGRLEVTGTARVVLLYQPDGETGLRRMEVRLPFSCGVDSGDIHPDCSVLALPAVREADARLINPRKVLVRVGLTVPVQAWAPVTDWVCGGVVQPEEAAVEQLTERCETCMTVSVGEKPFSCSDEVTLPPSRPEAEELLKYRVMTRCGESKVIGSKLIFKGEVQLQLLCRGADGSLYTAEYELPFSQIMEVSGAGEEAACSVWVAVTEADCALDGGGGREITVQLGLLAQAVVRETQTLSMLTDVYSTAYELHPEFRTCTLSRLVDRGEREITLRELLETGSPVQEVWDAYASIGEVTRSREGDRWSLTAPVTVSVLCVSETGEVSAASRPLQAVCTLELPEGAACSCRCSCAAPVFATPTAGGVEVRFPVRFDYVALESRPVAAVSAVQMDQDAPRDHSGQASIVLRRMGEGERLWDIAKSYGTTASDILQANALEEEEAGAGRLLLIPRKR